MSFSHHSLKLFLFFASFLFFSCSHPKDQLLDEPSFRSVFNEDEIIDMQTMFDFFNSEICKDSDNGDLNACYRRYFVRMEKNVEKGDMETGVSVKRLNAAFEEVSPETLQQFWKWDLKLSKKIQNKFESYILFNNEGKYVEWLKLLALNDPWVKKYVHSLLETGDVSPTVIADILLNHKNIDIKNTRIKFIIAVHYLYLAQEYNN